MARNKNRDRLIDTFIARSRSYRAPSMRGGDVAYRPGKQTASMSTGGVLPRQKAAGAPKLRVARRLNRPARY